MAAELKRGIEGVEQAEESICKKSKLDLSVIKTLESVADVEILNAKEGDFVFMKASVGGEQAIVKVRSTMKRSNEIADTLGSIQLETKGANKAWCSYEGTILGPNVHVDIFCPAVEDGIAEEKIEELIGKQVKKLTRKEYVFVRENAEYYKNITLPYINSLPESDVKWVHNIMDNINKEECASKYDISKERMNEKVVFSDPDPNKGFALLVDFKWKKHPKTMVLLEENPITKPVGVYCIAFPVCSDIRSLRDLSGKHLPLLLNLKEEIPRRMKELYGLAHNKLRMFVHYHPQFWYFHLHVTSMDIDFGIENTRSKLLEEIISNLQMDPNYYQNTELVYSVPEDHPCAKTEIITEETN